MQNLMPTTTKVYDLLIAEGVAEEDILEVINNIQRDIEEHYAVRIIIEENYFNMLKDMVWYNLERGKHKKTLADFGSKYRWFMELFDEANEIKYDDLIEVLTCVERIKKDLRPEHNLVQLLGSEKLFSLKANVYFIDKRENKGNDKSKREKDSVTCIIKESMSAYKLEEIKINSLIDSLIEALQKALKNHSKVVAEFV